jgi:unsaturated rhamnogalacturonyl hydrolase
MKNNLLFALALAASTLVVAGCCGDKTDSWSVRMADSEMARNPESWMLDFSKQPKWNYCPGMENHLFLRLYEATGNQKYFDYVKAYCDSMVLNNGDSIRTYRMAKYNIDLVAGGRMLIAMHQLTGEEKYKAAADLLRQQMRSHPRTSEGGFWHKSIYPHQMWLDGIFMASPFLAEYGKVYGDTTLYDEVAHQITLIAQHTRDSATGLLYHGWDESREQRWSNPQTGCSPNFWSRSMGWYMMALVDVLELLPEQHPRRAEIVGILQNLSEALAKQQDPATKTWYQVTNMGGREGNYLESSGTTMFGYAWAKASKHGWLDKSWQAKAQEVFDGVLTTFIHVNADSTISIAQGCIVSGLGGEGHYRDGSYEYYIGEKVRDNDPKAVVPFALMAMELGR